MEFIKTKDQTKLAYRDMGDGTPVILIHGWPLNADMFEYQTLDLLRKGFRVITYDRRGFGHSDQTGANYDYNTFADDLNAVIETLQLQKVSLVGFSMGGGEIARYLSRFGSAKIASVALVSSVFPYMQKDASNPDGVPPEQFAQMISQLEEDRPAFLATFTKQFFGENIVKHPVSTETKNWCFNMAMMASLKGTIDSVNAFGKTDFRPDAQAFTVPTLIIHGDSDKTVPIKVAGEAASKMIPKAQYKVYEGAPHGLFITHKQQLNQDLYGFLEANRGVKSERIQHRSNSNTQGADQFVTRQ